MCRTERAALCLLVVWCLVLCASCGPSRPAPFATGREKPTSSQQVGGNSTVSVTDGPSKLKYASHFGGIQHDDKRVKYLHGVPKVDPDSVLQWYGLKEAPDYAKSSRVPVGGSFVKYDGSKSLEELDVLRKRQRLPSPERQHWHGGHRRVRRSLNLLADSGAMQDSASRFSGVNWIFTKYAWPAAQELVADNLISSACVSGLLAVYAGLRHDSLWALKFVDASGSVPSGLLHGSTASLGSYDQCQRIKYATGAHRGATRISGSYCTVRFNVSLIGIAARVQHSVPSDAVHSPFENVRIGVCIPSTCTRDQLQRLAGKLLEKRNVSAVVSTCRSRDDYTMSSAQVVVICLVFVWFTFIIISTIFHLFWRFRSAPAKESYDSLPARLPSAMSALNSTSKLLQVEQAPTCHLYALSLMKIASVVWIIVGFTRDAERLDHGAGEPPTRHFAWNCGAPPFRSASSSLGFTTLFFLSGVIAGALSEIQFLKIGTTKKLLLVLTERYIRLTIPALFAVGVYSLYPLLLDGPIADEVMPQLSKGCLQNWWTVPLHVNNLNINRSICYAPLWYVSSEIQISIAVLGIVVILGRHRKASMVFLGVLCSVLICGTSSYIYATINEARTAVNQREVHSSEAFFRLPLLHAPAFIIGTMLHKWMNTNKQAVITKVPLVMLCAVSVGGLCFGIGSPYWWQDDGPSNSRAFGAIVCLVGARLLWCIGVASFLYICSYCKKRSRHQTLGCRGILVLSRLSHNAYLCAWMISTYAPASARSVSEDGHFALLGKITSNSVLSFGVAFLVYLVCDGPADSLWNFLRSIGGGRTAPVQRRPSVEEFDKKVQFLSELLGVEHCRGRPTRERESKNTLRRVLSLKDMVLHL